MKEYILDTLLIMTLMTTYSLKLLYGVLIYIHKLKLEIQLESTYGSVYDATGYVR